MRQIEEEQKIGKLDESVGQGGAVEGLRAMQETGSVAEVEDEERETHVEYAGTRGGEGKAAAP